MAADIQVDIRINHDDWTAEEERLSTLVSHVLGLAATHARGGQIDLLLTGDEEIQALNAQWRDRDKPTDVLSFPSDDEAFKTGFLGDIVISYGVMSRDADQMGKTFDAHFSHLLVHGFLHLLGYDHETDDDAAEMEALEIKILAELGVPDPYSAKVEE